MIGFISYYPLLLLLSSLSNYKKGTLKINFRVPFKSKPIKLTVALNYNCDYQLDLTHLYPYVNLKTFWVPNDKVIEYPDEKDYLPQKLKDYVNFIIPQLSCGLGDINPRYVRIDFEGSLTLHIENPFRPATLDYFMFITEIPKLPKFLSFKTKGETIKSYKLKVLMELLS